MLRHDAASNIASTLFCLKGSRRPLIYNSDRPRNHQQQAPAAGPEAAPVSAPKVVRQLAEGAAARPAVAKKSAGKKKQAAVRPAVAKKSAGKKKLRPWHTEDGRVNIERKARAYMSGEYKRLKAKEPHSSDSDSDDYGPLNICLC